MAVGQLPDQVREFARYLRDLLVRLDQGAGWCGVFWSRDPEGMQACLDGAEVPPWDVVEALLHDLAAGYGAQAAERETERARALHGASLAAYDERPGGRGLLGERLDMMLTEQRYAVERQAELGRSLADAVMPDEVERLNRDLAWVRDDHERATARCAELRERIERLDQAERPQWVDFGAPASDDFVDPPQSDLGERNGRDERGGQEGRGGYAADVFGESSADGLGARAEGGYGAPSTDGFGGRSADVFGARPGGGSGARSADGSGASSADGYGAQSRDVFGARPAGGSGGRSADGFGAGPAGGYGASSADVFGARPAGGSGGQSVDGFGSGSADGSGGQSADGFDARPAGGSGARPADGFDVRPEGDYGAPSTDGLGGRSADGHGAPSAGGAGARVADGPQAAAEAPAASSQGERDEPRQPKQGRKARDTPRRSRRPRGARFAGLDDGAVEPLVVPGAVAQPPGASSPRGARYAYVGDGPDGADEAAHRSPPDAEAGRATAEAVAALVRLRGEGRSGEAHGVLVEAVGWPAARLPEFAGELHRAGLGADWSTLLWEAASLPPDRLVALADALAGSGRADDCRKLLRQGVARPAPEIAESVLALIDAGREREARALLDAYLRVRTPEDAAGCAHTDPYRLIPLLLQAAQGVSDERHWDLVHALRVAGFSA